MAHHYRLLLVGRIEGPDGPVLISEEIPESRYGYRLKSEMAAGTEAEKLRKFYQHETKWSHIIINRIVETTVEYIPLR